MKDFHINIIGDSITITKDITSKTIKMLNSVNMINIFVELINKLRRNSQTEV